MLTTRLRLQIYCGAICYLGKSKLFFEGGENKNDVTVRGLRSALPFTISAERLSASASLSTCCFYASVTV